MLKKLIVIILVSLLHLCPYGASAQSYSDGQSTVLSKGKWVKARVSESGLYRLSAKTLSSWGYSDISKVAVYSNGGGELPLLNSTNRALDLSLLPVFRTKDEVVFYISGRETWKYNNSTNLYECSLNEWDEYTYIFVTDETTPSPSLESQASPSGSVTHEITYNSTLLHHELHKVNIHQSGRNWYGEALNKANPKIDINFGTLSRVHDGKINVRLQLCSATKDRMEYNILYNDSLIAASSIRAYQSADEVGVSAVSSRSFSYSSSKNSNVVTLKCTLPQSSDIAYLDFISVEIPTSLQMPKSGIMPLNISQGTRDARYAISKVTITSVNDEALVWCIDNPVSPKLVTTSTTNDALGFEQSNTSTHRYIAFLTSKVASLPEPSFDCNIENQNLHAISDVDYLIVYHPIFKSQAEDLAQFHRQHSELSVVTVNVDEIYNEFGGGQRSAIAIRDFVRHVYQSSNEKLKYLLLFGSGSYDNLSYGNNHPFNLIPTYQSAQSLNTSQTYCTDDFFGWLEDNELSYETRSTLEIGIGRFPVTNTADAQVMVDRVKEYMSNPPTGSWINRIVQFACEGDSNEHATFANENAEYIESVDESIDVARVFSEAYPNVQTTVGREFPLAINDFYNNVNKNGAFLVNYVGHGGPTGAGKYIDIKTPNLFSNKERLPFMIGATCDFAPFDRYEVFVAKDLMTHPYGGFIAILSTTRLVYGNNSHTLNMAMLEGLLAKKQGNMPYRIGDAVKYAKRKASSMVNSLKYVLIGDPALILTNNVEYSVSTDSICGEPYESCITPIRAMTTNSVVGAIRDEYGTIIDDFNGEVEVSLFDKRTKRNTLGAVSPVFSYSEWGGRLFHSTYKVTNGRFYMPIQLSKDIDAVEGYGRLSYVAWTDDGKRRAKGGSNMVLVGGLADEEVTDNTGPSVKLYFDYPSWLNGATTSSSPMFYAILSDESGINSSGVGIGHNITLTIDDNPANSVILDNYYTLTSTNPEVGKVMYQLDNLTPGIHKVSLKVWDNMGNSTSQSASLLVAPQSQIQFDHIAYTSIGKPLSLHFFHNNASATNSLQISIYDLSGKLMSTTQTTLPTGTTDSGTILLADIMPSTPSLSNGIYILNVKIVGSNGRRGEFTRKLVL